MVRWGLELRPRLVEWNAESVDRLSLTRGADLYQTFRKFVPLDAPLAADVVSVIARETGLGERRIRELARRYGASGLSCVSSADRDPGLGCPGTDPDNRGDLRSGAGTGLAAAGLAGFRLRAVLAGSATSR